MGAVGWYCKLIAEGNMTSIETTLENPLQLLVQLIMQCDPCLSKTEAPVKDAIFISFCIYYKRNKAKETARIVFKLTTWTTA